MSSPVAIKVSASFADSVRAAAIAADRSLTGQIEHWAKLGRAAEEIMPAPVAAALKTSGGNLAAIEDETMRERVMQALGSFRSLSSAEKRSAISLGTKDTYEPDPDVPGEFIRVSPDGTRTRGRLKGRTFIPAA